jgi:beta-aspartyl-peptidase (threonine type)
MRMALPILLVSLWAAQSVAGDVVLVIHGGAGAPSRQELTAQKEAAVRAALEKALRAGFAVISKGGSALDAVTAPIVILEDSPFFNAGRGAALNAEGAAELDAAIMEGHTLRAGAVAAVHRTKNPIRLARGIMEKSEHVMMVGDGAEKFGRSIGIEMVEPSWFITPERQRDLEKARAAARKGAALPALGRMGTVGAVALDAQGRLAAATSTGGLTNKRYGRVGDTPIIGAGTYADGRCGVSATGWGEFFIRVGVAREICARVAYRKESITTAASAALAEVARLGGDGGVIALDARGNVATPFNTAGMYRGTITRDGKIRIEIYGGDSGTVD